MRARTPLTGRQGAEGLGVAHPFKQRPCCAGQGWGCSPWGRCPQAGVCLSVCLSAGKASPSRWRCRWKRCHVLPGSRASAVPCLGRASLGTPWEPPVTGAAPWVSLWSDGGLRGRVLIHTQALCPPVAEPGPLCQHTQPWELGPGRVPAAPSTAAPCTSPVHPFPRGTTRK